MRIENTINYADYFKRYGIRFGGKIRFSVDDYGTVHYDEPKKNTTRRDVYSEDRYQFENVSELARCVEDLPSLVQVVKPVYDEFVAKTGKRLPEEPDFCACPDDVIAAARLFGKWKFLRAATEKLEEWLSEPPGTDDEDWFDRSPNPVSSAYRYFRRGRDCKDIGITIVEGEHPGSDYYAARLMVDIEEANEKCIELDLPYVFVEQ